LPKSPFIIVNNQPVLLVSSIAKNRDAVFGKCFKFIFDFVFTRWAILYGPYLGSFNNLQFETIYSDIAGDWKSYPYSDQHILQLTFNFGINGADVTFFT